MSRLFAARTDSVSGQVDILYTDDGVDFVVAVDDTYIASPRGFSAGPRNQVYWGSNQDYPTNGGAIYTWDGSAVVELVGTPTDCYNSSGLAWSRTDGRLYAAFDHDVTPNVGYWDDVTETWTMLPDAASLIGSGTTAGHLAITSDPVTGDMIDLFYMRVGSNDAVLRWGGSAWVVDVAVSAASVFGYDPSGNHQLARMFADGDVLYLLMQNKTAGGTPNKTVYRRDAAGVWTDISPPDASVAYGTFRGGAIHEGDLYVSYNNAAFTKIEIWKRSGTTWTMDFDSIADNPASAFVAFQTMQSWNGELFAGPTYNAGTDDYILVKTGSTWAHRTLTDAAFNFAVVDVAAVTVTEVVPPAGPVAGGDAVEVVGSGFEAGAEVLFEHTFAADVVVVSDTSITCRVPAHPAAGFVDVTVTNPDGAYGVGADLYEYTDDTPLEIGWMGSGCVAGSVVPPFGSMAGGEPVTIHGSGFVPGMEIYFGDTPATDIVYVDPTEYTCVAPPHQVGPVDIVMITP